MFDWRDNENVDLSKEFDVDVNAEFDLKAEVDKEINIDVKVESDADIKDNVAQVNFDIEAFGDNSFTELDLFVLTTDDSSTIAGSATSAVD